MARISEILEAVRRSWGRPTRPLSGDLAGSDDGGGQRQRPANVAGLARGDELAEEAESPGGIKGVVKEVRLDIRLEMVPRLSETLAPRDLHITRGLSVRSCLPPRSSPSRAHWPTSMLAPHRP